ncbi:5'-_3' exoribonculease Dhp1 [Taphrina deformans PYCC 5710]|uniref:5'-3' exoribonuclease n=1 Tax=Taphrina deformans (strain PYCC 5710 / ATCC 11124 / CBS 356.35 / IMI 108563 / JCM 9778 / NBRC 8474) TaxID=1097556 RepID=R4XBL5_TAPDE|nr:5'->3' exoribonculease Dhp1 [Taphrina deformans PYCC 5710]|eukprot:CCG80728.1 5'-_3' exoribonculease Dhp1 [Taphrina deformans PYCC 5710]
MGVPALFRFLSRKYPKIVSPVREAPTKDANGDDIQVDISQPNPNGEEFDNLYLDMNGIVHPCSHPEDRPPPKNEDEIMMEIFRYTDRIMAMVRPRKLLMIAVDGVAPRAKMNQQRSRRFRSAQEAEEKEKKKEEAIAEIVNAGGTAPDESEDDKPWDSNVITPGTPFMDILAASLRYWVQYKLNTDPGWKDIKIIISDASVPGEGEHKIMEFIRSQRIDPRHDPNTKHVIYGLDADLIMLGLATHEPYFRVLREDVFFQQNNGGCRNCGEKGHFASECTTIVEKKVPDKNAPPKPFIWLNVAVLREYLEVELHIPGQVVPFDLERAIDDWVFFIFFVGNDFLPHLPSLDIREGAIDALLALWKKNLDIQGGYITCDGSLNLQRAQFMLDGLAEQEEEIFRRRQQTEERNAQRDKDRAQSRRDNKASKKARPSYDVAGADNVSIVPAPSTATVIEKAPVPATTPKHKGAKSIPEYHDLNQTINGSAMNNKDIVANRKALRNGDALEANMSAAAKLKAELMKPKDEPQTPGNKTPEPVAEGLATETLSGKKRAFGEFTSDGLAPTTEPEIVDTVRLWEDGYKERYYVQKFKCDPDDVEFRRSVARDYVEGLAWVLLYYYQGCHSWTWFYPHHYAPFASDFDQMSSMTINFSKGEPARPYEQLLGVMPVASNHVLPEPLRKLMTDEEYGITDFYPLDFPVDLNGKKFAWQGVVLLPFIDQARLLEACAKGYQLLTTEESKRNARGYDQLIFSEKNGSLYDHVVSKLYSKKANKEKVHLDMNTSGGLAGNIQKDPAYTPNSSIPFPLQTENSFPDIDMDTSVAVKYTLAKSKFVHKSMLLKGVRPPPRVLDRRDLDSVRYGTNNGYGGQRNNDRYGNNNRARDVQDPSQNRTAPKSNSASVPPWAPQAQAQPYGSGYGQYAQPPPTGQHTYFGAPPPLQNGVPVPIPGFPPQNYNSRPAPPASQYQAQPSGSGYGQAPPAQNDPYSRYQSGSGYGGSGYGSQSTQQWRGYQH